MAGRDRLHRNSMRRSEDGGGIGISSLGNTSGTSGTQQLGTYVLQGSNGITLSQLTGNAGQATLVIQGAGAANIAIAAGANTISSGTANFSASQSIVAANPIGAGSGFGGGLSFSFNGQTVVGNAPGAIAYIGLPGGTSLRPTQSNRIIFSAVGNISISSADTDAIAFVGQAVALAAGGSTQSSGTAVFSNSNGISFSLNGSTITAKMPSVSAMEFYPAAGLVNNQPINSSWSVNRWHVPFQISATEMDVWINYSCSATNSTNAGATVSLAAAIYTMSGSTASLASSAGRTISFNSTLGSYTANSGNRYRSIGLGTWNITPGDYLVAYMIASVTGTANATCNYFAQRNITVFGGDTGNTNFTNFFMRGVYSAISASAPVSMHLTDVIQTYTATDVVFPWFVAAGTF